MAATPGEWFSTLRSIYKTGALALAALSALAVIEIGLMDTASSEVRLAGWYFAMAFPLLLTGYAIQLLMEAHPASPSGLFWMMTIPFCLGLIFAASAMKTLVATFATGWALWAYVFLVYGGVILIAIAWEVYGPHRKRKEPQAAPPSGMAESKARPPN